MQGRAAAGAVRGLQPSILGRPHAAHAICARFAWTGTSAPRSWCCCCVLACHHARAGACCSRPSRAPSVRTDGPTGRPGERCASGWCTCMDRALRTARHFAASGVRAYATMRAPAATPEAERWRSAANGLTTAVRSRFASRQCTLLHEQDPRDRAVWSAACSSCHPGQLAWLLFNCGAHVCCF